MKCFLAFVFAVVLVNAEGKVVPDVEQTGAQQPAQLSDYIKQAQTHIDTFGAQIREQLNLPNNEEFLDSMKQQSTNLANNVQDYLKSMSEEIKSKGPEMETIWNNFKTKVSEAFDNMQINPETQEQLNQVREKFREGIQTLMTESDKASKTISENSEKVQEGISNFAKKAVDIAVQATQNLNNQLQQTATTPHN